VIEMIKAYLLQILLYAVLGKADGRPWWDVIPSELRIIFPLVWFIVELFVLAVVLYLAGLVVVGGKRALFTDAFLISLFGTVLSTLFFLFIPYSLIASFLSIFVWLLLIKRLYETGWLSAIAVGILAIIIFLVVVILLALVFGILAVIIERFLPLMILMV
jgi:hypothetical protein